MQHLLARSRYLMLQAVHLRVDVLLVRPPPEVQVVFVRVVKSSCSHNIPGNLDISAGGV